MSEFIDEQGPASVPEVEKYFHGAKEGTPIIYTGEMQGETFTFYFNLTTLCFLCEGVVHKKDVKMSGVIEVESQTKVRCIPKFGIMPQSEKWIDTSDDAVKEFNLGDEEIDLEGSKLKRVN